MVHRRHVFYFAGYDPVGPRQQYLRFRREIGIFARNWNLDCTTSEPTERPSEHSARWTVVTRGPAWSVETVYEPLLWHDLVEADLERPELERLARSAAAFWNVLSTGTAWRYFDASWRYGFYFLYPYLWLAGFALFALGLGGLISAPFSDGMVHTLACAIIAVIVFSGLLQWAGRRRRVTHALDNWIFGYDHTYGRRHDVEQRLKVFAGRIGKVIAEADADEILIVGHSVGATLGVEALALALAGKTRAGAKRPAIGVLTVGSTLAKFTLHPAASRIRRRAEDVSEAKDVFWHEVQSSADWISFYGFHPVSLTPIDAIAADRQPQVRVVKLDELIDTRRLWKKPLRTLWHFPKSMMRLHYQFVLANRRRAAYDYFMTVCGPFCLQALSCTDGGAAQLFEDALRDQRQSPNRSHFSSGISSPTS